MLTEDAPAPDDLSIYGAAKRFEEALGLACARRRGFSFIALRYCAVFGARNSGSRGMARVRQRVEDTASGESVVIEDASGEERAQLTYVKDAVRATVTALDHPSPIQGVYNVAGPPENYVSVREYHLIIQELFPGAGDARFTGRSRSLGRLDARRIRRDLGFVPRYSVVEGLRDWRQPSENVRAALPRGA